MDYVTIAQAHFAYSRTIVFALILTLAAQLFLQIVKEIPNLIFLLNAEKKSGKTGCCTNCCC